MSDKLQFVDGEQKARLVILQRPESITRQTKVYRTKTGLEEA